MDLEFIDINTLIAEYSQEFQFNNDTDISDVIINNSSEIIDISEEIIVQNYNPQPTLHHKDNVELKIYCPETSSQIATGLNEQTKKRLRDSSTDSEARLKRFIDSSLQGQLYNNTEYQYIRDLAEVEESGSEESEFNSEEERIDKPKNTNLKRGRPLKLPPTTTSKNKEGNRDRTEYKINYYQRRLATETPLEKEERIRKQKEYYRNKVFMETQREKRERLGSRRSRRNGVWLLNWDCEFLYGLQNDQ